ncbi:MAG TPA: Fic family protein [Candidatus Acidoferrum sp.]|nr:Fic family protein [Candidatus Acidoferrum sp.]
MPYIHELNQWPHFKWQTEALVEPLADVRYQQGLLLGKMRSLGYPLQLQASLNAITEETIKSSSIEGETLNPESVRSSFARRLGVPIPKITPADQHVEGIVRVMMDATKDYSKPLTTERLFAWHAALFPTGYSGLRKIRTGAWRQGKMQVVSGREGNEKVHFEAPLARRVKREMKVFLSWFNAEDQIPALIRTGLAHLYFVTIHPFDDGNGRIARAITELSLAKLENSAQRFYSMSSEIREQRKKYYAMLESAQKGGLDVTEWLAWFLNCLHRAMEKANALSKAVLEKDTFWRHLKEKSIEVTPRQQELINRLLGGFTGKLTTEKWAKIMKISHDSALRDIHGLIEKGILKQANGRTKGASYLLVVQK